jgi:hypothetical protein
MNRKPLESEPLVIGALKSLVKEIMPRGPIERMEGVSQNNRRGAPVGRPSRGIRAHEEKRKPRFTRK